MSPVQKYRIGGAVSLFVSLMGTGVQYRWPEQKWIGTSLIVLGAIGLMIFIVAGIVRNLTIREYERLHPESTTTHPPTASHVHTPITNTNNPVFAPVFAPSFNQSQEQVPRPTQAATTKQPVPSEVECTDCYVIQEYLEGSNRLSHHSEGMLVGGGGRLCNVAQADFYLKPLPDSNPWIELRTQLIFYDANGSERIRRVSDGMWREQKNHVQMRLRTGDTRRLVIALESERDGFATYEYNETKTRRPRFTTEAIFYHFLSPKIERLKGDNLTVKVIVIGKYLDEVKLNQEFWFRLSRPEPKIEQISSPRGIETDMKLQF